MERKNIQYKDLQCVLIEEKFKKVLGNRRITRKYEIKS